MLLRSRVADEQTSSLGGWLFADLFLLVMVIGLAGFSITSAKGSPNVTTGQSRNISSTTATITGLVDAGDSEATVFFRWATNSKLSGDVQVSNADESPIPARTNGVEVSASLSQLRSNTTYYYQVSARNLAGSDDGEIRSFKTDEITKGQCSSAPSFIKDPFQKNYTVVSARRALTSDISNWVRDKGFVEPKVAVAFVTGWSNNPAGDDGAKRAREFYRQTMIKVAKDFFDVNTALRAIQNSSNLPDFTFSVQLYFVEVADQC